jgi:hypothetical protein
MDQDSSKMDICPAYNSLLLVWSTGEDGEHDNQRIQCGVWILKTQRPQFKTCNLFFKGKNLRNSEY